MKYGYYALLLLSVISCKEIGVFDPSVDENTAQK